MIHFDRVAQPAGFQRQARKPGLEWLRRNPQANRPKDYWSPFKSALADGFHQLCGYSAMYEPVGTVDHFISCRNCRDQHAALAYSWRNYRFASHWINASKQNADATVLDPFKVRDGWFEILLPSLQLMIGSALPPKLRSLAEHTIDRLHLRDDERVIRQRREWYRMHKDGELTLPGLRAKAPLIARAVEEWQREKPNVPLP